MRHLPKRFLALFAPLAIIGALFVVPAMASANVTFEAEGAALEPEAPITAEGSNLKTTTEGGLGPTLECENVFINGEVGVNNAEPATLVNGTGAGENCEAGGNPVAVNEILLSEDAFFANGTDVAQFVFHYVIGGVLPCTFTGTNAPTTWTAAGKVTVNNAKLVGSGPEGCPKSGVLSGDLILTSKGAAVTIS